MADATPTLPSWLAEAGGTIAAAVAARLAWLLRSERRQKATDLRHTAAQAVLEEIERSRPPYRIPTPWVDQFRTEAAAVTAAQMRAHEDHIRPQVEQLADLRPRVTALESQATRIEAAFDRFLDNIREDRREDRKHLDARLDALAELSACRSCGGPR